MPYIFFPIQFQTLTTFRQMNLFRVSVIQTKVSGEPKLSYGHEYEHAHVRVRQVIVDGKKTR